jgi:hypothetical protein
MASLPYQDPYNGSVARGFGGWGSTPTRDAKESAQKDLIRNLPGYVSDPSYEQRQQQDMFYNNPMFQDAHAQQGQTFDSFGAHIAGLQQQNANMQKLLGPQWRYTKQADQFAQKAGQAATQNAQMDIARQGALQSRGGMTPSAIRQSMMLQGQTSAGMQAQIAAQRMQARQEAQRAYLAGRQQLLQNQQANAQLAGQRFDMASQMRDQYGQEFGGTAQIGSTYQANLANQIADRKI